MREDLGSELPDAEIGPSPDRARARRRPEAAGPVGGELDDLIGRGPHWWILPR